MGFSGYLERINIYIPTHHSYNHLAPLFSHTHLHSLSIGVCMGGGVALLWVVYVY